MIVDFATISNSFQGILLDAYGVFWSGNLTGLIPGAKDAMCRFVKQGKVVGILSNSTQMASKEMEKIKAHGIKEHEHYHFFITSGEVAKNVFLSEKLTFKTPHKKFYIFGKPHPKYPTPQWLFQDSIYVETAHIAEADFIYIPVPHIHGEDQTDPKLFHEEISRLLPFKLPMVCANPDRFAHEGNPSRLVVRQGSIAKMYEELGGTVFYIGKPSPLAYVTAMDNFAKHGINTTDQVLMVGDTPETDIKGARNFGMRSALITKTGIMAERIAEHDGFEKVVKQLAPSEYPDYFIEGLAHNGF